MSITCEHVHKVGHTLVHTHTGPERVTDCAHNDIRCKQDRSPPWLGQRWTRSAPMPACLLQVSERCSNCDCTEPSTLAKRSSLSTYSTNYLELWMEPDCLSTWWW